MSNEKRIISKSKLDAIAGAIREKTGSNSTYTPDQMVAAIGAIETQGDYQEKTFTENGTYTPDAGYDAFSQVTVNVQSSGITPTGNINITDTTQTDVAAYATAQVVDANLVAANIKKDITILGILGTLEGGTDGLDELMQEKF